MLLHELAHVKRRDCLTHVLAQAACAFHWFNPLAWLAVKRARTERERACDDLVLACGTRGSDYADQLLEMARVLRGDRFPALLGGASLAMAHRSQLEGRLIAILDPRLPRAGVTRGARARGGGAVLLRGRAARRAAAVDVATPTQHAAWIAARRLIAPARQAAPVQRPPTAGVPHGTCSAARGTPARAIAGARSSTNARAASTASARTNRACAAAVADPLAARPELEHRRRPSASVGRRPRRRDREQCRRRREHHRRRPESGAEGRDRAARPEADPRMVAALTAALKDTDKEVRETAMHALVQLRDPSIFEPLVQALKDGSPDVREQAAFGLGQLRDRPGGAAADCGAERRERRRARAGGLRARSDCAIPAAVDALAWRCGTRTPSVREQAVFALGQIRDRRAVEPLISALKDADADVREQAAFALGQIRDTAAVDALIVAVKDADTDVREQVVFALGQLRDPRAIDALTIALKDQNADVRKQAAFALGQLAR